MRLIDAYDRGYITTAQYTYYLDHGYTNDTPINVDITPYVDSFYGMSFRLIKRDPNLRLELTFEIDAGAGKLSSGNTAYVKCPVDGRIMGYSIFLDASGTAEFDVGVKATYPPTRSESIVASAPPTVTTAYYVAGNESSVSTWDRSISAGDYVAVIVASNDNAARAVGTIVIEPATQLLALI